MHTPGPLTALVPHAPAAQVRLGLERHREELQRQVASLDSQVAIGRARLDDAAVENTSLNQRLALERNRWVGVHTRPAAAQGLC